MSSETPAPAGNRASGREVGNVSDSSRASAGEASAPSEVLARALVAELASAGVRHVVLCPGSRSAPLAYALADAERSGLLNLHVRVDERGAGFVALGLAKASGLAAVVTTSGTAVANLHPALLEASHGGFGLIVLSADRPAELRGTGANQTTHQPGIFGVATRYDVDLAPDPPDSSVRGQVRRAVAAASGVVSRDPGPVHLNVQFRPPLGPPALRHSARLGLSEHRETKPVETERRAERAERVEVSQNPAGATDPAYVSGSCDPLARPQDDEGGLSGASSRSLSEAEGRDEITEQVVSTPLRFAQPTCWPVELKRSHGAFSAQLTPAILEPGPRTVVVAGDGAGAAIAELAMWANWPLFAEPSSGARTSHAIALYRELLRTPLAAEIERVVVVGHPTLSRPVSNLLARRDVEIVVVSEGPRWTDVAGTASRVVPAVDLAEPGDPAWLEQWRVADRELAEERPMSVAESLAAHIWEAGGNLVLGSSSPIRAFDTTPTSAAQPRVWANRGLAGIDGTIATATGLALGLGEPVRAVVGDLTFLHDATSLVRGVHESEVDLQVIVFDDGGGSIFGTLEYGSEPGEEFERIFAAPQRMDIPGLAHSLGAQVTRVDLRGLSDDELDDEQRLDMLYESHEPVTEDDAAEVLRGLGFSLPYWKDTLVRADGTLRALMDHYRNQYRMKTGGQGLMESLAAPISGRSVIHIRLAR